MYTLDANVFVRDANPHDVDHRVCRALLAALHIRQLPIIMPATLLAEVAGPAVGHSAILCVPGCM